MQALVFSTVQRVRINVSMAFIFNYMHALKWAVSSTCKLLSFVFDEIVCNLFFKIVLVIFTSGRWRHRDGPRT